MLYPIIRRVRRPLLPSEPPQRTATAPAVADNEPVVAPATPPIEQAAPGESVQPLPPLLEEPKPEPKPVTPAEPKRAKASKEKSR